MYIRHPGVNVRPILLHGIDVAAKFYEISGVMGIERPIVPCFKTVFTELGHHMHEHCRSNVFKSIFTDDNRYRESNLASALQGAPYSSFSSDRSRTSASEKSMNA